MKHQEYRKIVPGAKTAILFIHGIVGTPNHFTDAIPLVPMVPEDWSICNVLLPGHGGSVTDFGRSSMQAWKQHVWDAFTDLADRHDNVILAAHSMGTLFALQLSVEYPKKVSGLFLLAVPIRPWLRPASVKNMLRVAFGSVRSDHPIEVATQAACGIMASPNLLLYVSWIPRYLELFQEIVVTEKLLSRVSVPCAAFQSEQDELVMNQSKGILEKVAGIRIELLPDSTHFYYPDGDKEAVLQHFETMCEKYEKQD